MRSFPPPHLMMTVPLLFSPITHLQGPTQTAQKKKFESDKKKKRTTERNCALKKERKRETQNWNLEKTRNSELEVVGNGKGGKIGGGSRGGCYSQADSKNTPRFLDVTLIIFEFGGFWEGCWCLWFWFSGHPVFIAHGFF